MIYIAVSLERKAQETFQHNMLLQSERKGGDMFQY